MAPADPHRRRDRRLSALAILSSVALHAALLLAIALQPVPPEPPPDPDAITITLVETPGAPTGVPGGAPAPGRATTRERTRGDPTRPPGAAARREQASAGRDEQRGVDDPPAGAAPRARERSPSGAPPAPGGTRPSGEAEPGAIAEWFEERGLGGDGSPGADGTDRFAVRPSPELPDEDGGEGGAAALSPQERLEARLDDMLAEMKARDLARYPDTSWMDLRDALALGFTPDFGVLRGSGNGLGDVAADAVAAYLGSAGQYGREGIPYENSEDAPGRAAARTDAAAAASGEGRRDREALKSGLDALEAAQGKGLVQPWAKALVTVVAVEQDAAGAVVRARITQSSGNRVHDRLALESAQKQRGRAPAQRLAGAVTEWAFVTEFSVVPPVPTAGIQLDANFKPTGVVHPLKRSTRTRVELVSVRRSG